MAVKVAVSWGELIDKITILEIKRVRLGDAAQRANVETEYAILRRARDAALPPGADIAADTQALLAVNQALWDIEDDIRACERAQDFGPDFIELARAVYITNDRRAAIKRRLNQALGSDLIEEKSYTDYTSG
jgi:hypothetical protein